MSFTIQDQGFCKEDFIVFYALCAMSCAGGVWYSAVGTRRHRLKDTQDYLLGGKSMATLPVGFSLIASFVSAITVLGTPTEIYNYGSQYYLVMFGMILSCTAVAKIYIPVYFNLKVSSSYEYLELRFNRHVRAVASFLFLLDELSFLPMVVYVPALSLSHLTGYNVFAIGGVMVAVCGLYTTLGGLRAVVWTDLVQIVVMFVGVFLAGLAGTVAIGGFKAMMDIAYGTGRLDLSNWSFSLYERQTGWGAVIGGCMYWLCDTSVSQTKVQRYIAVETLQQSVWAVTIFCIGIIVTLTLCVWCGLAAWVAWVQGGCRPGGAPLVDDRLIPAFVAYTARVLPLPGLPGVFLAGIFGAGISTLSAELNACALVVVEDIMRGWLKLKPKKLIEGIVARLTTITFALIAISMMVVIKKLGGILGISVALSAIAASSTCGMFTLGMVCWWVGPWGAISGAITGALVAGIVTLGSQAAAAKELVVSFPSLSEECAKNASYVPPSYNLDPEAVFPLFRLSYHWVAPLGFLCTLTVGAVVGWCFDRSSIASKLDAELYTPVVWRFLPREAHENAGITRRNKKSTQNNTTNENLSNHLNTTEPLLMNEIGNVAD